MERLAEPNNMIAESKLTNTIDPCNTQTANQWMYVLPSQAASQDQFWRKMRHWQIKWSSSEAYPAVVKWNKFSKHMKNRLQLWEAVQSGCLNWKKNNHAVILNKYCRHYLLLLYFVFLVSGRTLLYHLLFGPASWTTRWFIDLNTASR